MKKWTAFASLLTLTLMAAPAQSDDGSSSRRFQSEVRVFHASPAPTPSVDVIANDALTVFQNVAFGTATDYQAVSAGVYNVKVVETGTTAPAVIDDDLSLFYATDTTVVATGIFPDIVPVVLEDDNSRVPMDRTRVRFFHGSPDTGAVSVQAVDGPIWVDSLEYRSASPYIEVPAGTYDLEVRVLGTDVSVVVPAGMPGGSTVTVWAIGLLGDASIDFVATVDSQRSRRFRHDMDDDDDDDDDDEDDRSYSWLRGDR